jgi:hypothetical protein
MSNGFKISRSVFCSFWCFKSKYTVLITLKQYQGRQCENFARSFLTELELNTVSGSITLIHTFPILRDERFIKASKLFKDFRIVTTNVYLSLCSCLSRVCFGVSTQNDSIIIIIRRWYLKVYIENAGKQSKATTIISKVLKILKVSKPKSTVMWLENIYLVDIIKSLKNAFLIYLTGIL